jgi:hypothetical protein
MSQKVPALLKKLGNGGTGIKVLKSNTGNFAMAASSV